MIPTSDSPLVLPTTDRAVSASRPPGSLRVSEAVAYFETWLGQAGKKPGNYPRIAAAYVVFCLQANFGFDPVSLSLFALTKKTASQASAARKFVRWHECVGQPLIVADLPTKPALPPAVHSLILEFIDAHHSLRSVESRVTYTRILNGFFLFLAGETEKGCPDQLSERSVRNYMDTQAEKQLSAFTRRLYLTVIQQLVSWVLQQRDARNLSMKQIEDLSRIGQLQGPRIDTTIFYKDPLSGAERDALMSSLTNVRDRALLALMAWGGLRTVEIVRLRLDDVDLAKNRLFVKGKGRETRQEVGLHPECQEALRAYLADDKYWLDNKTRNITPKQGRPLFAGLTVTRSIRRKVRQYLQGLGLATKRRSAHSLRHTAAQQLLSDGVESVYVQRHLRHANFQSTLVYTINHFDQGYLAQITDPHPKKATDTTTDLTAP